MREPTYGAVVMVHGMTGTAYQRFYSDGLWHGTNGQVCTWEDILAINVIVLHETGEES